MVISKGSQRDRLGRGRVISSAGRTQIPACESLTSKQMSVNNVIGMIANKGQKDKNMLSFFIEEDICQCTVQHMVKGVGTPEHYTLM